MPKRSRTTLGIAILLAILADLYVQWPTGSGYPIGRTKPLLQAPDTSPQIAPNPGPDLRQMAAHLSRSGLLLTPEQKTEEKRVIQGQIDHALQLLHSHTPKDRQIGVEQLSAYQTPETEKALRVSLVKDTSETVRAAAATSLGKFKYPGEESVLALSVALLDADKGVSAAALMALRDTLKAAGPRFSSNKRILNRIEKAAKSPRTAPDVALNLKSLMLELR